MADRHRKVKELFLEARALPPAERGAWLEASCEDDAVRADVASLLAAEEGMATDYLSPWMGAELSPGAEIGRYRIVERLGAGGMGEVWLAQDPSLDRRVALKFPIEDPIGGPSSGRVRREARAAASLEHAAVCRVFEIGEADGRSFIVMEYVQGETLSDRLARGPVPPAEALAWAAAIAAALEEAHEKGILHRDLKPANVMLTPSGEIKVMDFGLARVTPRPDGATGSGATTSLTAAGFIAGTPAYMAPEQLCGQPADRRSDIWAFGCVLFELLTGRRAFSGESAPEGIAAILEREPDWLALPAEASPEIRRLLRLCLRKDPHQRLRHVGDARLMLDEAVRDEPPPGAPAAGPAAARPWWRSTGARVGAALILAGAALLAVWQTSRSGATPSVASVHATVTLPPGLRVARTGGTASSVALSPDGRTLVVAATGEDGQRLYRRSLDRPETVPLAGTENGLSPFFSPDGTWIGFFADGRLRRVPAAGGVAVDIAPAPGFPLGASWGVDDRIVFSAGPRSALRIVPARGGEPEPLTSLDAAAGEVSHRHPEFLPDGRTLLFTSLDPARWSVTALDLRSGRRVALADGATPRYAGGYVVLNRGSDLLAAPFDGSRLELSGTVVPVLEGVAWEMAASSHYGLSRDGTLVYVPAARDLGLVLVDGQGPARIVGEGAAAGLTRPRFSPDGTRLAVASVQSRGGHADVWIHDLEDGGSARLTFEGGEAPVWTPDGAAVTFAASPMLRTGSRRGGLYMRSIDGRGDAEHLFSVEEWHRPIGWTPDGRMLAFEAASADSPASVYALANGEARLVLREAYAARLSPDGRWLTYHSEESGRAEVYVTPFPDANARWQISAGGGRGAAWTPDGTAVYYRNDDRLIAASIETGTGVRVTSRRLVLEPFVPSWPDEYDIHPDGRTLALVRPLDDPRQTEIGIVIGWSAELQRPRRPNP